MRYQYSKGVIGWSIFKSGVNYKLMGIVLAILDLFFIKYQRGDRAMVFWVALVAIITMTAGAISSIRIIATRC